MIRNIRLSRLSIFNRFDKWSFIRLFCVHFVPFFSQPVFARKQCKHFLFPLILSYFISLRRLAISKQCKTDHNFLIAIDKKWSIFMCFCVLLSFFFHSQFLYINKESELLTFYLGNYFDRRVIFVYQSYEEFCLIKN